MHSSPSTARKVGVAALLFACVALISVGGSYASLQHVDGWYAEAQKVPWDPPNAVFGPVWTVLYVAIAASGWLIWRSGYRRGQRNAARGTLWGFAVQLALNAAWTPMFFAGYPAFGEFAWAIALAIIIALAIVVVWLAIAASHWSKPAAWIMVPYLAWLLFATSLCAGIMVLN